MYDPRQVRAEVQDAPAIRKYKEYVARVQESIKRMQADRRAAWKRVKKLDAGIAKAQEKRGLYKGYMSVLSAQIFNHIMSQKIAERRKQMFDEFKKG